jgi:hypothetical protein
MEFPRAAIILVTLALMALGLACEDDEPVIAPAPTETEFRDLSQKWHVLNNVEVAYNKRRIDKYDELLDLDFTFFLTTGDVGGGLPEYWGRAEEKEYNTKLFDSNYSGANRCKRIQMDLVVDTDDPDRIQWTDVIPDPGEYPGEVWKMATIYYEFKFDMEPDDTYRSLPGAQATFTVRNVGTAGAPLWKLVEMRDLGGE